MSKKMWNKIFKSKSAKTNKTLITATIATQNINKRRSIYDNYQQINTISFSDPPSAPPMLIGNEDKRESDEIKTNELRDSTDPVESNDPSTGVGGKEMATVKSQSKFSRVVQSFTLKRSGNSSATTPRANKDEATITSGESKSTINPTTTPTNEKINKQPIDEVTSMDSNVSENINLTPCSICGRTFVPTALQRHVVICQKAANKKRKVFDSSRQRREGTDLAAYLPKGFGLPASKQQQEHEKSPRGEETPLPMRKQGSDGMIRSGARASVRKPKTTTAMGKSEATVAGAPAAAPAASAARSFSRERKPLKPKAATSEECPHCNRCFGIKAYDRHVEWCKEKALQNSVKPTVKNERNLAKERLEARTKYRAPTVKSKRSINREKYSDIPNDENEDAEVVENPEILSNNPHSMMSSMTSERDAPNVMENDDEEVNVGEKRLEDVIYFDGKDFRIMGERLETFTHETKKKLKDFAVDEDRIEQLLDLQEQVKQFAASSPENADLSTYLTFDDLAKVASTMDAPTPGRRSSSRSRRRSKSRRHSVGPRDNNGIVDDPSVGMDSLGSPLGVDRNEIHHPSEPQVEMIIPKLDLNANKSMAKVRRPKKRITAAGNSSEASLPMKAVPLETFDFGQLPSAKSKSDHDDLDETIKADIDGDSDGVDDVKFIKTPKKSQKTNKRNKSGLPDHYDPFLSAKRQLEELCSPSHHSSAYPNAPSSVSIPTTPRSPLLPLKMTTSLTLGSSYSSCNPSHPSNTANTTTNTTQQHRPQKTTTPSSTTSSSNFRRTSSLRGSRRSPMLASRPFFAQNYRPTIQRGLSDEGPISTNFLKPEEYDEMPVRSVCVNDYAITNSPRVVRRDTSNSNRKHNLKLNIQAGDSSHPSNNNSPSIDSHNEQLPINAASRFISKTDSLAVFLKYENEIESNGGREQNDERMKSMATVAAAGDDSPKSDAKDVATVDNATPQLPLPSTPKPQPIVATDLPTLDSLVIAKEHKDMSNALSKQNSAKNIRSEVPPSPPPSQRSPDAAQSSPSEEAQPQSQPPPPQTQTTPSSPPVVPPKPQPTTPVAQVPPMPMRKNEATASFSFSAGHHNDAMPVIIASQTTFAAKRPTMATTPASTTKLPALNQGVTLNAIFGDYNRRQGQPPQPPPPHHSSSEYIDPKLINKFDNLPVTAVRSLRHTTDSESSDHQAEPTIHESSTAMGVRQLPPVLDDEKSKAYEIAAAQPRDQQQQHQLMGSSGSRPRSGSGSGLAVPHTADSHRNSAEGRSLLKRKMRFGRNQFLYDASPEAVDSDEGQHRPTMMADHQRVTTAHTAPATPAAPTYDRHQQHQQQHHNSHYQQRPTQRRHTPPPPSSASITSMPVFDDFDFEEFLSSFENDDDQEFPLFKDCKEFIRNHRSAARDHMKHFIYNNTSNNTNTNNNMNNNRKSSHDNFQMNPPLMCSTPLPHILTNATTASHRSSRMNDDIDESLMPSGRYESSRRKSSSFDNDNNNNNNIDDDDDIRNIPKGDRNKKREIFISIETEQNDLGLNALSPNALRDMVGNGHSAMVEVELDDDNDDNDHDNKFSKISDDDIEYYMDDDQQDVTIASFDTPRAQKISASSAASAASTSATAAHQQLPNVQLNNAKNIIQKMQKNFRNMSEEVAANMRQEMLGQRRNIEKTPFPRDDDVGAESDDVSSVDGGYTFSAKSSSSRRGVSSKPSVDSAYGSLSRQRSTEGNLNRCATRPSTANATPSHTTLPMPMMENNSASGAAATGGMAKQQQKHQRGRDYSGGSSSSGSDNCLPPICNKNYQMQQQQMAAKRYHHTPNRNADYMEPLPPAALMPGKKSISTAGGIGCSVDGGDEGGNNNNNHRKLSLSSTSSNSTMTTSMKMSKFCHECGSRFIIDHAKFCMDCGVKRIIL